MINENVMYNFFINLNDLLKISIFIKNHSNCHMQSKQNSNIFARSLFINVNTDLGYRKLENLTSKHTELNVCKNDCTCARNMLSFYLLYVNEIAKNGCFVVKRYAVREAKTWRYAVHNVNENQQPNIQQNTYV